MIQAPLFPTGDVTALRLKNSETFHLFEAKDWGASPLGPVSTWPASLLSAVRLMIVSPVAMALLAGRDGILLYNDRYSEVAGQKHPACFGVSALLSWPEVVDFNAHVIERIFAGETLSYEDQKLTLYRNGEAEDVWFDLDYSPIYADDGNVVAVFAIIVETTKRVCAERALAESREQLALALEASAIVGTWDWHVAEDRVFSDAKFATLYGVDPAIAVTGAPMSAFMAAIHPDDIEVVLAVIEHAMRTGEKFSQEYRVVQENGHLSWILAEGKPLLDDQGTCIRFPGIAVDISQQKQVAESLARSEDGFRTLADAMPQMVWSTRPDGFHDYYNARWYEFTGMRAGSTDGEGWNGMFHADDQARAWEQWRHSLATGEPYQIEYRLRHHSGAHRWVLGRALASRNDRGEITRWYGTCTDIHDAKQVQAEREVVAHELSHRIKNIFSVLSGIIALSARTKPQARDFADDLRRRIEAMGRAHDFVRPRTAATQLPDPDMTVSGLLQSLMEPYKMLDSNGRITFEGDDAPVGEAAATPLALLLHELATNSVKYGALSHEGGRLAIRGRNEGANYRLMWTETGAVAAVQTPPAEGFGSRLMKISVEGQLDGIFSRKWQDDGILVDVTIPLASLARSGRLPTAQA